MRLLRIIPGAVLGVFVLAAAGTPASAQFYNQQQPQYNQQQGPYYNPQPPQYGYRAGQRPGNPGATVQVLPPESLGPGSLGLLERDFQYMRNTSPHPDSFLYGRWNPRYQVITPPVTVYPGGGYGWPVYGGYGYYDPYAGYGGPGYGYGAPNIVQRQVVVVPGQPAPGTNGTAAAPSPAPVRPDADAPKPDGNTKPDDDFYLKPRPTAGDSVSDVLDDIRKAWLNGDWDRLKSHIRTDGKVRIYPHGQFKYSVEGGEFAALLKDAMARIDTVSFELDRPKSDEAGKVFVTGKHVFMDADKQKRTTYVSYGLERVNGSWKIVEAGSSSDPIGKHTD